MRYRVELQPATYNDIEQAYRRLEDLVRIGELRADYPETWYDEIEESLYSLEEFPHRCPFAPEADLFRRPLRHMLLRNSYRIIFEVRDATVWVLHVRHQRQQLLGM